MKLKYVEMSGFRGYRNRVKIDFGTNFTIIDGRNGVGKSTLFDAVEFALTGTISKYPLGKADKETVDDYVWWRGEEEGPEDRYVRVGFEHEESELVLTRTSLNTNAPENLLGLSKLLCDVESMPSEALKQLCSSSIIRDEHIAALSLDLKESERYDLLSSAIGVTGAEDWINKADSLHKMAKENLKSAENQVSMLTSEKANISRELDSVRATLLDDKESKAAIIALNKELSSRVSIENLATEARTELEKSIKLSKEYESFIRSLNTRLEKKLELAALNIEVNKEIEKRDVINDETLVLAEKIVEAPLGDRMALQAERLAHLAKLGEEIGCENQECPLCQSSVTNESFLKAIIEIRENATNMHSESVNLASKRDSLLSKKHQLEESNSLIEKLQLNISSLNSEIVDIDIKGENLFPGIDATPELVANLALSLSERIERIQNLIPLVDTSGKNSKLRRVESKISEISSQLHSAESRLAIAKRAAVNSKSLYDSVRRSSGESLTLRLERILPLITELYARLRPHPSFDKIEYKMRGELKKYLTFRVGENINPQFVYSSGQRRATGLAFLIAVNLSLAWSKWQSLLLDDPVQHIDDFRSIHLAELLAHLVSEDKQIICAVEDPALADLLCRKMPVLQDGGGKRITLGLDSDGDVNVISEKKMLPSPQRVLHDTKLASIG